MENIVAKFRRKTGFDWAEIGELVGVHRTTVMRWEKGEAATPKSAQRVLENELQRFPAKSRSAA